MERAGYRLTKDDNRALITIFGTVSGGFSYALQAFCIIVDVIIVMSCTNLMEGFIYSRILKFMKL